MNVRERSGHAAPTLHNGLTRGVTAVAMPQVTEALSTWRWMTRQIPRAIGITAAVAGVAAVAWATLSGGTILLATSIALECTALLSLWLERQWRKNEDLSAHMDHIANNALHAGDEVLEGLQDENSELDSELQSVRRANERLNASIEQLRQERTAFERVQQESQAELAQFRETERLRSQVMAEHRTLVQQVGALLESGREQIAQEGYWQRIHAGLNQVTSQYQAIIAQEQMDQPALESLGRLIADVRTLRSTLGDTEARTSECGPLQESLEQVTHLLTDLSQRLLESQQAHLRDAALLENENTRVQTLEIQMASLQSRLGALQQALNRSRNH